MNIYTPLHILQYNISLSKNEIVKSFNQINSNDYGLWIM